jgi:regulator of protease activity HflC (stomatin/prohibitin superfamily)
LDGVRPRALRMKRRPNDRAAAARCKARERPVAVRQPQERAMLFVREFVVRKHEQGLLFRNGDFVRFLAPGTHRFFDPRQRVEVERYDLSEPAFEHRLAEFFVRRCPQEVECFFLRVETGAQEIALVSRDGHPWTVVPPESRALFWKGVVRVTAEIIDIAEQFAVSPRAARALTAGPGARTSARLHDAVYRHEVPEAHVGLLYVDGKLVGELAAGAHAFWRFNRTIAVEPVDLRVRTLEVAGPRVSTKDKVGVRINVNVSYRFTNARLAATTVKHPLDHLRNEVQLAVQAAAAARTLDALLDDTGAIDRAAHDCLSEKLEAQGIEVRAVGIKDVVLETSVGLRLEALEQIAGEIGSLSDDVLGELIRIKI